MKHSLLIILSLLICAGCRIPIPGVDKRSQGSIDSQKAYERSRTNALNGQPQNETIGAKNGTNVAFSATNSALNETKAPFRETDNLLPAVSTRAVVVHPPPNAVTNLWVTWTTPGDFGPLLVSQGQTNSRYLVTWIEERNGASWYQRTPAFTPQATNQAVIANTNRNGLLRAAWGWK